ILPVQVMTLFGDQDALVAQKGIGLAAAGAAQPHGHRRRIGAHAGFAARLGEVRFLSHMSSPPAHQYLTVNVPRALPAVSTQIAERSRGSMNFIAGRSSRSFSRNGARPRSSQAPQMAS